MARPKKRFQQLIEEIDRTPWGPAEQALVAEAVALAIEIGDERLEYEARMRQTASANMVGATDVMLNSFAWCLAHHDADPQRFPADLDNGGDEQNLARDAVALHRRLQFLVDEPLMGGVLIDDDEAVARLRHDVVLMHLSTDCAERLVD